MASSSLNKLLFWLLFAFQYELSETCNLAVDTTISTVSQTYQGVLPSVQLDEVSNDLLEVRIVVKKGEVNHEGTSIKVRFPDSLVVEKQDLFAGDSQAVQLQISKILPASSSTASSICANGLLGFSMLGYGARTGLIAAASMSLYLTHVQAMSKACVEVEIVIPLGIQFDLNTNNGLFQTQKLILNPITDFFKVEGVISLPPKVHERRLLGRKVLGTTRDAHEMGGIFVKPGENEYPVDGQPHKEVKREYSLVETNFDNYSSFFSIRAIPLEPTAYDPVKVYAGLSGQNSNSSFFINEVASFPGEIKPDGSFSIDLPPYEYGYMLIADTGKDICLQLRLPNKLETSLNSLVLDATSTVISKSASLLYVGKNFTERKVVQDLSNTQLQTMIGATLMDKSISLIIGSWQQRSGATAFLYILDIIRDILDGIIFPPFTRRPTTSPISTISPTLSPTISPTKSPTPAPITPGPFSCEGSTPDPRCYDNTTDIVYNLMTEDELTLYSSSFWKVEFSTHPAARIRNQYSNGMDGVSILTGFSSRDAVREEDPLGFLKLVSNWPGISSNPEVIFDFDSPTCCKSVGLTIQNGVQHSGIGSTWIRRPFKFEIFDASGAKLHQYNWYTNQDTIGFFGLTSPTTFRRLKISFKGKTGITVDNLVYSDDYIADNVHADPDTNTIKANLGWRSQGNWQKKQTGKRSFNHPWSGIHSSLRTSSLGVPHYSGGSYWEVGYGPSEPTNNESVLIGPAFTLTNLPVILGKDEVSFGKWHVGIKLDENKGYDASTVSSVRIPDNNGAGGGPVSIASSTSGLEFQVAALSGFSPGNMIRFSGSGEYRIIKTIDTGTNTITLFESATFLVGHSIQKFSLASSLADSDFHYHEATAPMNVHWSHVHWQANIGVEFDAQFSNTNITQRFVEYSTDNGASWRNAYWWEDESHHGVNDYWHLNHMHPYSDSDMNENDFDGSGTVCSDFDKDQTCDYTSTNDNNLDGVVDPSDDEKEWDTEFYHYYEAIDVATLTGTGFVHPYNPSWETVPSQMEGSSIVYRFRFVGPESPSHCEKEQPSGSGNFFNVSCVGWQLDDVAFNNDDPDVGYYTNFDGAYDSNL